MNQGWKKWAHVKRPAELPFLLQKWQVDKSSNCECSKVQAKNWLNYNELTKTKQN